MPFLSKNLSALCYANGFTLWHYRSTDLSTEIDNVGYFNTASTALRTGDFILVNVGSGATVGHGLMVVVDNNGSVVDVANINAFATVDSD